MNNFEKITYLLEKKNLTEEEKLELDSLIKSNPETAELYDTYMKLSSILKSKHITLEDLRDYILYKNNLEPENRDIIKRIPEIELHLKNCEQCTDEFKVLNQEFTDVDLFVADKFKPQTEKREEVSASYIKSRSVRTPVYAFASIVAIGFIYLALLVVSNVSTPDYYDLASVSDNSEYYVTRGRATDEFQQSLKALEDNNFERAVEFLENDIKNNSEDNTIFYTHYILGLAYLEKADNSFAGLFKTYNEEDAEMGLKNLQFCIEKNTSGKYPDITYNAYFYSAKASLMLGKTETAKEYLKIVDDEKGSKMIEAKNLLNELE
ncbi:MAG: hypothetical protein EHM47_06010 [Ignavibacteriales bacterium]|nr:MAG: hypothetical protein EHM47_06010 [Ignavibacteriales bacterium]